MSHVLGLDFSARISQRVSGTTASELLQWDGSQWQHRGAAVGTPLYDAYVGALEVVGAKDITWNSDGGGDIGAIAANRPNNIYVATAVTVAGSVVMKAGDSAGGDIGGTYPSSLSVNKIRGDDVYASIAPTDGQALIWDNDNSRWDATTIPGGATTLAALTDTNVVTPAGGHVLIWDAVNSWDNKYLSGDVSMPATGVVTVGRIYGRDLDTSAISVDDKLVWNNSKWEHTRTSRVRAYKSGTQGVSSNTDTVIVFNAESYDTRSEFNTGTYKFTATESGYYSVGLTVQWAEIDADARCMIWVELGTTNVSEAYDVCSHSNDGNWTMHLYDVIYMTATSTLECHVQNFSGNSTLNSGERASHFEVHKMI